MVSREGTDWLKFRKAGGLPGLKQDLPKIQQRIRDRLRAEQDPRLNFWSRRLQRERVRGEQRERVRARSGNRTEASSGSGSASASGNGSGSSNATGGASAGMHVGPAPGTEAYPPPPDDCVDDNAWVEARCQENGGGPCTCPEHVGQSVLRFCEKGGQFGAESRERCCNSCWGVPELGPICEVPRRNSQPERDYRCFDNDAFLGTIEQLTSRGIRDCKRGIAMAGNMLCPLIGALCTCQCDCQLNLGDGAPEWREVKDAGTEDETWGFIDPNGKCRRDPEDSRCSMTRVDFDLSQIKVPIPVPVGVPDDCTVDDSEALAEIDSNEMQ